MWSAGAGFSIQDDAREAAAEACGQAREGAGNVDAALLFAGPAHREALPELLHAARAELGCEQLVGSLAHGVIGAGQEREGGAGLSVLALSGLDAQALWVPELAGREEHVAHELAARLDGEARPGDLVVLIPDPGALHPERLLEQVREVVGEAAVVGAGAGDPISESPLLWCGRELEGGALAGLVIRGARARRVGVAQACRPVGEVMTVTRASGPWVLELDGRPALDRYREAAGAPLAADLGRAAAFVLVALPCDADAPLEPGGYRVRNVAGFAPDDDAFAIPEPVARGARLAFVHREPESARADLKSMLAGLGPDEPGLALYFDCCARGAGLFGVPGLESAYLSQAFGKAPLAGMFGSCEIGPIGGRPELLTYTGVLALLDR